MADLTKKKRTRGGHKSSATKMIDQINATTADDTSRLPALSRSLQEKLETINALDSQIFDAIDDEGELTAEIEQADVYKEAVYAALIKAGDLLKSPSATAVAPTSAARSVTVKLPKLQLRHFSGDLTKWTSFWQSFQVSVDRNPDLSDVEKFNYLSSLLEGVAGEAIAGLSLTEENYAAAVTTLKKRFGSTQQIVSKHMEALLQIEPVTNSQNVKALRRLFDTISSHMRSLASLKIEEDSYGNLLCPVLVNKIPADMQLLISRKIPEAEWKLQSLMTAIEEEITARERLGQLKVPRRGNDGRQGSNAHVLINNNPHTGDVACCYCDQSHSPTECTKVTQVEARRQLLLKTGRCFSCLRRGHLSKKCKSSSRCQECQGRHHSSICSKIRSPPDPKKQDSSLNPDAPGFEPVKSTTLLVNGCKPVLLQTASATVFNPHDLGTSTKLRFVLDNGSQRSYLTRHAKDTLHLRTIKQQELAIAAFGSRRAEPRLCDQVQVQVQTKSGEHIDVNLFVVPRICEPLAEQPLEKCLEVYPHLCGLDLADNPMVENHGIDMLIGSDFYWRFVTGEILRGKEGPVGINTSLGWVLTGPTDFVSSQESTVNLITTHTLRVDSEISNKMLDTTLKKFWELESLGITSEETEHPVMDQFTNAVKMRDNRYEVSLPWREFHDPLPTNYELSRRRLTGLLRRLKQTPEILQEYDSIIRSQLRDGIIEKVDGKQVDGTVHYLPHHAVIRKDKDTTKVRVVYDASSKSSGTSLNDCLHVGPKFDQRINELLLRFRAYPVPLVADIEKAFLMVSVNPNDRDALRFLWTDRPFDGDINPITLRFTRVVFGVSSSPFLLNATLQHHLRSYSLSNPTLVESLSRSMYVDDIVTGADTDAEAFQLYVDAKEILRQGSFNLRKFVSSSCNLQEQIDIRERSLTHPNPEPSPPSTVQATEESFAETTIPTDTESRPGEHKVLGVRWDVKSDQLVFDLSHLAESASQIEPTKRKVVSVIGQIYDPLGYLAPVTILFKVFMQEVFKETKGWDQPLVGQLLSKWRKLIGVLRQNKPLILPRHYFSGNPVKSAHLYGFCDASGNAYAAVVYIAEESDLKTEPAFVVSKTRVAPLKVQSIPRLELMATVLLARLITDTAKSLTPVCEILSQVCFTDSQVALCWIKGVEKDWKPFVQHRVDEVRRLVPPQSWSHCPGKENPADIPSRGLGPTDLSLSKRWRNGPEWLSSFNHHVLEPEGIPDHCMVELKTRDKPIPSHVLLTQVTTDLECVIECDRFSSSTKLYRVTALVLKFIQMLQRKVDSPELTGADLVKAEEIWIQEAQKMLAEEKKFPVLKKEFGLFLDERKLWRCGGRLQNADLPYAAKHPILLSKTHHLTRLLIREAHIRVQHNGVRETLTEVRSKFWIICGRSVVRMVIHKCVTCKRFEGRPYHTPRQPPLPDFRVTESPPFTYTGVDFAGPMFVRIKESSQKIWICLFTCCVSRAVHLEIVLNMTATTFLNCVKRFAARRGIPQRFVSDNAKTFKSAAKTLKSIGEHPDTQKYFRVNGIKWSFNLEKAPWWGGLFERMIQSTKRCLRKVVGKARLSYDEMHTAITEIEAIINSRPLSYVHPDDFEQPLTPSHLLVGRRLLSLPDHLTCLGLEDDEDFDLSPQSIHRRVKHLNSTINHFWKRWSHEYLLNLRDSHRQQDKQQSNRSATPGDIVVVHDEDLPRGCWKLARIQSLIVGRDGIARGAVVRVASSSGSPTILQRPLQKLYPLEIHSEPPHSNSKTSSTRSQETSTSASSDDASVSISTGNDSQDNSNTATCTRPKPPQRQAAIQARMLVRERCADDY